MKDRSTLTISPKMKRVRVRISPVFAENLTLLAVAVATFVAVHARADTDTFILDTFTDVENTWLSAHTVDVNLPAGSWGANGGVATWGEPEIRSGEAWFNADMGGGIPLSNAGSYIKPTNFTISADMTLHTIAEFDGGTGLGFYNFVTPYKTHGFDDFKGLRLMRDGTLEYVLGDVALQSVAWSGIGGASYVPGSKYMLTYWVDTATGRITYVDLSGSNADFSAITGDTSATLNDEATQRAGCVVFGLATGTFDNFSVGSIPSVGTVIAIK